MKKLFLPLLCGLSFMACVDRDYDLGDVSTDDIAIGDDESLFEIPLTTIRVFASDLHDGSADLGALLVKADTWLPAQLPDGADCVEIARLDESAYGDRLFDALLAEMGSNPAKLDAMADLIYADHRAEFGPLLGVPTDNETLFKTTFKTLYASDREVLARLGEQFRDYFSHELRLEPLRYDIGRIDISDEVVDMLADNLDPQGTPDPKNTLHLAGTVDNRLPLSLHIEPNLLSGGVSLLDFGADIAAERADNAIEASERTRIFAEELRLLVDRTQIEIPVRLDRYYPGREYADREPQLEIRLRLIKRGALKLDL